MMLGGTSNNIICYVCCRKVTVGIDNVCTVQPQYMAIPAGMLDGNGDFAGAMAREMEEGGGRCGVATCFFDQCFYGYTLR